VRSHQSSTHCSTAKQVVSVLLLLTVPFSLGVGSSLAARADVERVFALVVSTDPTGASVYVDGAFVGSTPVHVETLPAGPHRVRITKPGYLENSRTIDVSKAGEPVALQLRLTRDAAAVQAAAGSGGGILTNKWFWVGVAGAGAVAATAIAVKGSNAAPTIGGATASPTIGLAASTNIQFSVQNAMDPDNDSLTYTWDFGDGASASSQSASHVYQSAPASNPKVTVSDGKKSASAETSVTIRSMTGTWNANIFGAVFTLTQTGASVSGAYRDADGPGTVTGTVQSSSPRVILTVNQAPFGLFSFSGDPDTNINVINGSVEGILNFSMIRQ
jgi:hypothetical protein